MQWPSTADAHPAIRALQQLLAELLTASEPGAAVAEATKAAIQAGEEAEAAAAAAAAALGGARTTTPFEVTISLTEILQLYLDPSTYPVIALAQLT